MHLLLPLLTLLPLVNTHGILLAPLRVLQAKNLCFTVVKK
jgi:hypothetical protein